jgi:hypothetical protein
VSPWKQIHFPKRCVFYLPPPDSAHITICWPLWSNIKYIRMPRIWSIWLCVFQSGDLHVYLWMLRCGNIVFLTLRILDVETFTNLTSLSLLILCKRLFPIVDLNMSFQPNVALKSGLDVGWISLVQDRDLWRSLVNSVLNLRVPWNAGKLSSVLTTGDLSSSVQLHRVS